MEFVYSAAILRCQQYGLVPIRDRYRVKQLADEYVPQPFVPRSGVEIAVTDAEAAETPDLDEDAGDEHDFRRK